jgi:hypothetical protein
MRTHPTASSPSAAYAPYKAPTDGGFTFGVGLLLAMVLFFWVSLLTEKTSLGKWVLGRTQELYPMTTFSVFLHPRLSGATTYALSVQQHKADVEPRMIYPHMLYGPFADDAAAANLFAVNTLNNDITAKQFNNLERSIQSFCPTYEGVAQSDCRTDNPSNTFLLPADVQGLWAKSLLGSQGSTEQSLPYKITLVRLRWSFDPEAIQAINGPVVTPIMAFYPPVSQALLSKQHLDKQHLGKTHITGAKKDVPWPSERL